MDTLWKLFKVKSVILSPITQSGKTKRVDDKIETATARVDFKPLTH